MGGATESAGAGLPQAEGGARGGARRGAGALGSRCQTTAMEQAPPDPEKLLQPAPLEPLGGPGAVLGAAVGEETEDTREDGSGVDTVRRGKAEASGLGPGLAGRAGLPWLGLVGAVPEAGG